MSESPERSIELALAPPNQTINLSTLYDLGIGAFDPKNLAALRQQ
ncbi:hypothetical protein [Rhodoblastus sp.]